MNNEPWTKSKWTAEELKGASVAFEITRGETTQKGIGKLKIVRNLEGFLRIQVEHEVFGLERQVLQTTFYQEPDSLFRIERHPNPDEAAFHLTTYKPHGSSPAFQ